MPARTAVGYIRVSTETQLDGYGPEIQRTAVAELAAAEGITIAAMYTDDGISGSEDLDVRVGLADALNALADHPILIVPRLDRLARDLILQESVLADAWRAGAEVISCSATERIYCHPDNPDDPARTLIRQVLGAVAAYERGMIRLRLTRGRRRLLAATGYAGGPQPYGWTDEAERAVLAAVTHARAAGCTWRDIATDLNRSRSFKRNGAAWTASELHRAWNRATSRLAPAAQEAML